MAREETGMITGLREARAVLEELSRSVQAGVGKRALMAGAEFLAGRIRANAPVSARPNDPTPGSLRDSVKAVPARTRKGEVRAAVIAADPAAIPVEYGLTHKNYPRHPFFRPAVDGGREEAAGVVASGIRVEVDAAAARAARLGGTKGSS